MVKGSMENRIERLENQVNGEGLEAADLYDWNGNQVTDARIVKWPTREAHGLAIMADGSRREIATQVSLLDIIMERRRRAESGIDTPKLTDAERSARDAKYRDMLHLRVDGKPDIMERILSKHHGQEPERSAV